MRAERCMGEVEEKEVERMGLSYKRKKAIYEERKKEREDCRQLSLVFLYPRMPRPLPKSEWGRACGSGDDVL
jgi:hypothetical protein